jgi:hypothetical protein
MTWTIDLGEFMRYAVFTLILFAFAFSVLFDSREVKAQGVHFDENYQEWHKSYSEAKDGEFLLLVSADWCAPCGKLKEQLRNEKYAGLTVGVLDVDRRPLLSKKTLDSMGRKTIPTLIKFTKKDGKLSSEVWNGIDLEGFIKEVENEKVLRLAHAVVSACVLGFAVLTGIPRD